ncbi:hypothetical protein [Mesorhizobium sp. L-2-11]|uniref:hypothetical protein n=1 Tax=Mesorhizobium sp. L-2-11 TaxID=2744521 RepID=UPI0018EAE1C6|nr:hypothetical protein [Mesorhizobium sp. L-2-11]BCH19975.1 hypothetical protein MesoLjLa_68260 [Mesorhizobium sp. L-2-11]
MHILQAKAKKCQANGNGQPKDATYDFMAGVWRNHKGLVAFQDGNSAVTKKNDLETGEDQKGE